MTSPSNNQPTNQSTKQASKQTTNPPTNTQTTPQPHQATILGADDLQVGGLKRGLSDVEDLPKDAQGSKLTALLEERSGDSPLVVITLPKRADNQHATVWLDHVTNLLSALNRVILVQESGEERIQFYSE